MARLRVWTIALAVCGANGAIAQNAGSEITFTTSAMTLKRALEAISAQGGTPLMVSGSMADEFVTLRLDKAPRVEFEKRLAETFRAEWQQEAGGLRLVRTPLIQKKAQEEHVQLLVDKYSKFIEKKKKELGDQKPIQDSEINKIVANVEEQMRAGGENTRNWEQIRKTQERFPGTQVLNRILTMLDVRQLAMLDPNDRVVFSTAPNAMQRQLPREMFGVISAAMVQQAKLSEAVKRVVDEESQNAWVFDSLMRQSVDDRVAKALLIVTRPVWSQGLNIELRVVNQKGKYMFTANTYIQDGRFDEAEEVMSPEKNPPKTNEAPLELGSIQKQIVDYVKESFSEGGGRPRALPPELKAILSDPLKYEPLGYSFGDYFIKVAELDKKQLVAAPNDMMTMFGFYASMTGIVTAPRVRKLATSGMMGATLTEDSNWIQFKPADLIEAKREFLPRPFIAMLAKRLSSSDPVALDEWASIAVQYPEDPTNKPLFMFSSILVMGDGGEMSGMGGGMGWSRLRFYGLLVPAQRQALYSGKPLLFGSLTPDQKLAISQIVFRDEPNLEPRSQVYEMDGMDDERMDLMYNSVFNEVTEQLPNGIPPAAQIALTTQDQSGYYIEYSSQGYSSTTFGAVDQIAWHLYQKENPDPDNTWEQGMEYKSFMEGKRQDLNFVMVVSQMSQKQWSLQDEQKPKNGKKMTYDQLPDSVKAEIKKKVEEIKKSQAEPPDGEPPPSV